MSTRSRRSWQGRAILASVVIPPLVHLVRMDRLTGWLAPSRGRKRPAESPPPRDEELAAWADRVLGFLPWPWRRTCLKRSVVLFYLLGRAGRPAQLSIGVRRGPGDPLQAHAWLVRDGVVILEPRSAEVGTFETIALFPETPRGAS